MPSDLKLSVQSVTPDVTLTLSDPYIGSAYSPQVDVSEIDGGHEVAITYKAPSGITTDTFDVLDGVDGTDGVDGVSPTVEIESTTDAHTITITDVDGAHSYTVDTYADEEEARATAESSRVAAESSRVTAEQARATAESSRAAAESARVTAEASRATAEQSRTAAESSRAEAEQSRVTAETARTTAESARATAEQGRVTAEQSRATAETARASAESVRVTAEQGRASAENARTSAESARVTAESARASAETSRANAETARSNAESARASEWASIKAEAEDAISAAETATSDANAAASDATAAAAEARAASAATWLSGNVLFGELAEASVLTTDDAFAAPPKGVEVYGKSVQDGTPTPDAPVEIKSVDDLTLWLCGKNLFDKDNAFLLNGYFDSTGHIRPNNNFRNVVIEVVSNTTYTLQMTRFTSLSAANLSIWLFSETPETSTSGVHGTRYIAISNPTTVSGGYHYERQIATDADTKYISIDIGNVNDYNVSDSLATLQLEFGTTATAYEPYIGQSIEIPLSNHVGRSLPDGTRDELTLSYVGPSTEHEGWGVFSKTLTQYVGRTDLGTLSWNSASNGGYQKWCASAAGGAVSLKTNEKMCSAYISEGTVPIGSNLTEGHIYGRNTYNHVMIHEDAYASATIAQFTEHVSGVELTYKLAEPVTHDLGTVELPILPNPLTAWADGGSAQPTLSMTYEQDINIVIGELRSAIADMATS